MILSKHNVLFLKNPKTAGMSLLKAFEKVHGFKVTGGNRIRSNFFNTYYGETQFNQPEPYANIDHYKDIEHYSTYVVIRDPIDKFMSICRHVRDYGNVMRLLFSEELDAVSDENDRSISKEVRFNPSVFSMFSKKFQQKYQSISVQEIGERIIQTPIDCIEILDFLRIPQIFYFNDPRVTALDYAKLQEELHKVFKKHNIHASNLPKVNVGTRFPEDNFSPELVNKIKQVYQEDVEFYDKMSIC